MTFTGRHRWHVWFIEAGPLVGVIISLWIKMAVFSVSLRSMWAQPEESIAQWIHAYPQVFSATLASLLLLFGFLSLIPRRNRFIVLLVLDLFLHSWYSLIVCI